MKVEKGEDFAFISEAADRLTPFEGPVKFNESPALVDRNVTSVFLVSSSLSEDEEECTRGSITLSVSSNSSSISNSSSTSDSIAFDYLASF
jgi:hypothetical protein